MDEFSLIDVFFKAKALQRPDVVLGIGDDAACLQVPPGMDLLVSTDTLLADVHFLSSWDPASIAYKAVMVNLSDIAAMAAKPAWITLALTLSELDISWLDRFAEGLHQALQQYEVALIGGDTTRGPLAMTLTAHGLVARGKALRRSGAKPGDKIYVSGELGAAALAVASLTHSVVTRADQTMLMQKLQYPKPRVDLALILQACASSAIDLSDGLSSDLMHICEASQVGATLESSAIPLHPLVQKYHPKPLELALHGGEDYELCFTVPKLQEEKLLALLGEHGLSCYCIGVIESEPGLRLDGKPIAAQGYRHF